MTPQHRRHKYCHEARYDNRTDTMAKVEPDLQQIDGLEPALPGPRGVCSLQFRSVCWWEELTVSEWEIGDGKTRVVVPHHGAEDELEVNRENASGGEADQALADEVGRRRRGFFRCFNPPARGDDRHQCREAEECLRKASVDDG